MKLFQLPGRNLIQVHVNTRLPAKHREDIAREIYSYSARGIFGMRLAHNGEIVGTFTISTKVA
jgi:hypothetical protein